MTPNLGSPVLLGKPKILGTVTFGLGDDGKVHMLHNDFAPLVANLILDKAKAGMVASIGVGVKVEPKEGGQ